MTKTCCKIQVFELAKIFHSLWSVSSPVPPAMMAASKILQKAEETFCGSGDLAANDAINFHDYFLSQYPPGSANRDGLEAEFKHLETRLTNLVGWAPATHVTHVLNFRMGNEVQAPWQLGLSSDDSIKGPSKMVYIHLGHSVQFFCPDHTCLRRNHWIYSFPSNPDHKKLLVLGPWFTLLAWESHQLHVSFWRVQCDCSWVMLNCNG